MVALPSTFHADAVAGSTVAALDRVMRVTLFDGKGASRKAEIEKSLRSLAGDINDTVKPTKATLPWLKLAAFGDQVTADGSFRSNANMGEIEGVEGDYDGESIPIGGAQTLLEDADLAALLYTSPSHTADKPRWRVLCPCSRALPKEERAGLVARVNGVLGGILAGESFTLSQSYYVGRVESAPDHGVALVEGRFIDLADELDVGAIGKPEPAPVVPRGAAPSVTRRDPLLDGGTAYGLAALAD